MAGYCRQSAGDIAAGLVVKAAPVDTEFNCISSAFCCVGGHSHDGSSIEGAFVPLIADSDKKNYVCIDTTNNRVSFFTEVASTATEQLRVQDGVVLPVTDDDIDLGVSTTNRFKNLFLSGNAIVGGTSAVTGNATFSGTLGVTGVSTFSDTVCAPNICGTGTATLATVDINAGNIDNTVIGATTAAAGSFTTLSTTGQGTFATVDINGGTIDGATIGGTTAGAITGTTVTANTCFVGDITGDVSGNVTGNLTGNAAGCHTGNFDGVVGATTPGAVTGTTITANTCFVGDITGDVTGTVTGNVTGNLTGDVTSTGTSTFCDINMSGTAGIDLGSAKITSVADPTADGDAANKCYVDTQISNLIGGAPEALDTLNELAAAINDDAAFYTSVTTCLGTKLNKSGGTMTGDISLGANKATSTATPTTDDTLTRKGYVDTQDALKLSLTGGTMSGAISMGTSKITGLGDPTLAQDASTKAYTDACVATAMPLSGGTFTGSVTTTCPFISCYTPTNACDLTNKCYVDGILQSATAACTSAACALASQTAAATSESCACASKDAAAASASAAATSYDNFDDRYLGDKTADPSTDNDGDALLTGALYYNSTDCALKVYTGADWSNAAFTLGDALTCIQEDDTPVLGGALDANSQNITGANTICATTICGAIVGDVNGNLTGDVTGNVTGNVTGTVSDVSNHDTDDISEGVTNQYFTNARARGALQGGTGVTYTSSNGDIAIGQDVGTSNNVCFNSVCVAGNPTQACQLATKEYVDTIAAAGLHYHDPVRVQTTANLSATYDNGSSGVGATLTNNSTQAALSIDGISLSSSDRVLVTEQTNAAHNGVYTVTTVGSGSTNWVLTRSTDTDSSAPSDPDALGQGDAFFIKEGDTNAGHLDVLSTQGTITFGTTDITFAEVAETSIYSAGSGLTLTGTVFSATSSPTLCICGDATGSATFTNLGNANLSLTIADDSHNHTVANVDGLATCLSGKAPTNGSLASNFSANCLCADVCVETPRVCATCCVDSWFVTANYINGNNCVISPIMCNSTCAKGPIICGTTCVVSSKVCGTDCVKSNVLCAPTAVRVGLCVCAGTCVYSPVICGTTCVVAPDINATSDCRCKDNITTVDNAYCKIGQIRGVNYNWKDSGKYTMGVVAQEVEEAFPELVTTDDDGYKSVNYNGLVGALIETVKCLQGKVEELENGSKG